MPVAACGRALYVEIYARRPPVENGLVQSSATNCKSAVSGLGLLVCGTPVRQQPKMRRISATFAVTALLAIAVPGLVPEGEAQGASPCSQRLPLDVGLVVDQSGSVESDCMAAARNGAALMVDRLGPNDQSGLVLYSTGATWRKAMDFDHATMQTQIAGLSSGGSTATGTTIQVSHQEFLANWCPPAVCHIMGLLTMALRTLGQTRSPRRPPPKRRASPSRPQAFDPASMCPDCSRVCVRQLASISSIQ